MNIKLCSYLLALSGFVSASLTGITHASAQTGNGSNLGNIQFIAPPISPANNSNSSSGNGSNTSNNATTSNPGNGSNTTNNVQFTTGTASVTS